MLSPPPVSSSLWIRARCFEVASYRNGLKLATCLFEAAAWHYAVKIGCGCGHFAFFDSHGLWWHFHRRGLDDAFPSVRQKMWCTVCWHTQFAKVRPRRLDLVKPHAGALVRLPLPDDREWKRMVNRFRG
jgi:hypothetical protein